MSAGDDIRKRNVKDPEDQAASPGDMCAGADAYLVHRCIYMYCKPAEQAVACKPYSPDALI